MQPRRVNDQRATLPTTDGGPHPTLDGPFGEPPADWDQAGVVVHLGDDGDGPGRLDDLVNGVEGRVVEGRPRRGAGAEKALLVRRPVLGIVEGVIKGVARLGERGSSRQRVGRRPSVGSVIQDVLALPSMRASREGSRSHSLSRAPTSACPACRRAAGGGGVMTTRMLRQIRTPKDEAA